jgi:L-cysteine:1D-myo-inositol 2-amino-2-deoxy-alpha-D-glucopyranoside ligase
MKSWPGVPLPQLREFDGTLHLYSTAAERVIELPKKDFYQMYVCGITPYDATHLGHAATYLTFDLIHRFWKSSGAVVNYIQNITDIDDPLLERANRDGVDWKILATSQIDLFRGDMTALRILPPNHYEGAVDAIPDVIKAIEVLDSKNSVYNVENDKYFEVHKDSKFGSESHFPENRMLEIFAERGGDPSRNGKRDPLDALLWLHHRPGEPSWSSPFGEGRPGWHIECAAIALKFAKENGEFILDIQGGGSDLIFPHHEMSASQVRLLTNKEFARAYVHAGLIGLDGEKMSKSKGNLLFVSKMIASGIDPMVIRWALLKRHYRSDYMWLRNETEIAEKEFKNLILSLSKDEVPPTDGLIREIRVALSNDLDSPRAISAINQWTNAEGTGGNAEELREAIDALLGIALPS